MVGAVNKFPLAVLGLVIFNEKVTVGGISGILLMLGGGICYAQAKYEQSLIQNAPASEYIKISINGKQGSPE